jgi:hypothetical protein
VKPIKQLAILVGPEFGYLMAANVFDSNDRRYNSYSGFQHLDFGISSGICVYVTKHFGVEARYTAGFKTLIKGIWTDPLGNVRETIWDGSNRTLQVGLNYYL